MCNVSKFLSLFLISLTFFSIVFSMENVSNYGKSAERRVHDMLDAIADDEFLKELLSKSNISIEQAHKMITEQFAHHREDAHSVDPNFQ